MKKKKEECKTHPWTGASALMTTKKKKIKKKKLKGRDTLK